MSDCLTRKRVTRTDPLSFQTQLIGCVNFPWVPQIHDILVVLSKTVGLEVLPKKGFGVSEIHARVSLDEHPEDQEGDHNFEGEHTCVTRVFPSKCVKACGSRGRACRDHCLFVLFYV